MNWDGEAVMDFLSADGEMGALVRSLDWSKTAAGPASLWPKSLQTAVSICLQSRLPIVIWWGREYTLFYNDACLSSLGLKSRFLGASGKECCPELWHALGPIVENVLATGAPAWLEDLPLKLLRNNSLKETYWALSCSHIQDESGGCGGVFCNFTETTARVLGEQGLKTIREWAGDWPDAEKERLEKTLSYLMHTQRELRTSRELLQNLIDSLPAVVVVRDLEGKLILLNNKLAELYNLPKERALGTTIHDFYPKEVADAIQAWDKKVISEGRAFQFEEVVPRNGVNRTYVTSKFPLRDGQGKIYGIGGVITDISDRKRFEQELASDLAAMKRLQDVSTRLVSQDHLGALLEEIVEAAIEITGADMGNMQLLDPVSGSLKTKAQRGFEGSSVDFFDEVDAGFGGRGSQNGRLERVIVEDVHKSPILAGTKTLEVNLKAGALALQATPLTSREGRLLGMLSTYWRKPHRPEERILRLVDVLARLAADVIERTQAEERVRRSNEQLEMRVKERTAELELKNRELQDFAFVASHDLQEPLRKIQMFSNLVVGRCSAALDAQYVDYLNRMQDAATRMQALLSALLDYSRVTTKSEPFEPVDLNEIAREALSNVEYWIQKENGRVQIEDLPVVDSDRSQMVRLFQNLLSNGLKYHFPGAAPLVKLYRASQDQRPGETVRIVFEDNGIGFDEKYLDKIFRPFERLHGRSSPYSGVGMGLAICKKIVERHSGTITARSTPGKGSTFIVELPVRQRKE